ncbi:MAG: methyl-accepting chemotaxis sensory transducer [Myxococcaceae bacterium]|nr:methyl-accepting chemotaxis sensory transducer [Myxococcaceae bacterium]
MNREWTFGQKIGAGFAVTVGLAIAIAVVAVVALQNVVSAKDRVISVNAYNLVDAEKLATARERKGSAARGFLLTREEHFVEEMHAARAELLATLDRLRRSAATDEARHQLDQIRVAESEHQDVFDRAIARRRADATPDAAVRLFDDEVMPKREVLNRHIDEFLLRETHLLELAQREATETALLSGRLVAVIGALALFCAIGIAVWLTRTLGRQIGTAVAHVQSSSAELQAAAAQQATASREQATAMSEITTTISELMATSRQIAESAQRVAQIATETATSARSGVTTVERAHDSIAAIRRHMDLVVGHMLDLGKKSQQIGAVLDIVSELAEQTNILAINATIEAAGAGDAGRRFAVVADEIRKLADRVGGSTKEIRGLVEDVRSAVNTTVMATEGGSKAVDAGTRQFSDVAASFKQIVGQVATTTEAAREIELSTKQQATAVEQVNLAIGNVAQAAKETETSASQTLQTAVQLGGLSLDLLRLVRPQVTA